MTSAARIGIGSADEEVPSDRAGLVRKLARLSADVGAQNYLLLDLRSEEGDTCICACNWVFDSVREIGIDLLRRIAHGPRTGFLGQPTRPWHPLHEALSRSFITSHEAQLLVDCGHAEIATTRLRAGRANYAIFFSANQPRTLRQDELARAQLSLTYALCALAGATANSDDAAIVSERERECLQWVSEGKTTEEVSTIVGVSANTVNSYLSHAIRKLSARNRAMAIATAIRSGVI